jgi:hypothetical protein
LYCEHDGGWHLTQHSVYRFIPEKAWITNLKKHWKPLIVISLRVAPLAKAIGWAAEMASLHAFGESLEVLDGEKGPSLSPLADELGRRQEARPIEIETREFLEELIKHLDSERQSGSRFGGLHRHLVEDGRLLWLCPEHVRLYRPN